MKCAFMRPCEHGGSQVDAAAFGRFIAQGGNSCRGMGDERRFAGLAAHRHRKKRRIISTSRRSQEWSRRWPEDPGRSERDDP
jgi:hypothetical protein